MMRIDWVRGGVFWLLLIMLGSYVPFVAAQESPQPIDTYWQQLSDLQRSLYSEQPPNLTAVANQLENRASYQLENGRIVTIKPHSLIFILRQDPPDLALIDAQIEALLAARDSWSAATFGDQELTQLQQLLTNPEFDYSPPTPNPFQELLRDLWLRVGEFFRSLLPEQIQGSRTAATLLSAIGTLGIAAILAFALYRLYRSFVTEATDVDDFDAEAATLTADSALDRAQQFSSDGDFRTAVRYLYLSALLLLEEQGLLRYDRSQTNREYLRSVAHKPELAIILRNVIDVFDRVWYGFQPLAASDYESYVQQVEILKQQRGAN